MNCCYIIYFINWKYTYFYIKKARGNWYKMMLFQKTFFQQLLCKKSFLTWVFLGKLFFWRFLKKWYSSLYYFWKNKKIFFLKKPIFLTIFYRKKCAIFKKTDFVICITFWKCIVVVSITLATFLIMYCCCFYYF